MPLLNPMPIPGDARRAMPVDQGYATNYVRDQVMELYDWSRSEHEQRFCENALWYYRHYKNYVDQRIDRESYRSNIGIGLSFPIIELLHARLMEPWSQGDSLIEATAEEAEGELKAPRIQAYVNKQIKGRVDRAFAKTSLAIKSGLIFGRGSIKTYLRYERPQSFLRRISQMVMGVRVGSKVQEYNPGPVLRLCFDYCDPFDTWWTPGQRFLNDADWTFERGYLTTSAAHAKQESGEWDQAIEIQQQDALGYDDWRMRRQNLEGAAGGQVMANQHGRGTQKEHRRLEFQGRLEIKDSQASTPHYVDALVEILDERAIVRFEKLRTWNNRPGYIHWDHCIDPASERPIGVIEPMEDVLLEINDYENIALDNSRKILESPLLVDPNSTTQEKLYLGPGEINWIRNPRQSVAALEMKDLPHSFYNQIGYLNDLVQRISGVSDYFGGMNTADTSRLSKTATGMTLMASLSASRFGPLLTSLDQDFYRPLAQWFHESSKLWLTGQDSIRVPGNPRSQFLSIGPDDLDAVLTFNFNTRSLDPSSDKRRETYLKMIEIVTSLAQPLAMQGYVVDFYEMVKGLMDEFDLGAEVPVLLKSAQAMMSGMGQPGIPAGMPGSMGGPLAGLAGPSVPGVPGYQPGPMPTGGGNGGVAP